MRGLTPEERAALERLNSPPIIRGAVDPGSPLSCTYEQLISGGRVGFELYPPDHEFSGFYFLTSAGREALRLYPLMLALQAQP